MEALFVFMGLLLISMAYNFPRYGLHTRSQIQFGGAAFGPPPFGGMQFDRPTFRKTQFRRLPYRNSFHPRLYSEKYLRRRTANPSLSPWLRKNNPEITISDNYRTVMPKNPNASLSIFGTLITKQINAPLANESEFLWIARVVVTPEDTAPVICTAACFEERIFITAATCLLKAKVYYTRVIYQDVALQPLAFVLPSKPTKAMFHDIGLIVVNRNFTKTWEVATSFYSYEKYEQGYKKHPYEDTFMWMYEGYLKGNWHSRVAGYVGETSEQEYSPNKPNNTVYSLYDMDTQSSPFLCHYFYNQHLPSDKFFVPCYSACKLEEYSRNLSKCYNYLAGEGHIVYSSHYSNRDSKWIPLIFGVATWGGHYKKGLNKPPLPVGFATIHSHNFKEDLECARKIAKAPEASKRFDTFCQ